MAIGSVGLVREQEKLKDKRVALTPDGVKRLFKKNRENQEFKIHFEKVLVLKLGF